jgi:spore coat polysaccharide biosynthesis predicted glycosyltransferase SpsG
LKIEFITDGGPEYGLGHLWRSAALSKFLEGRGYSTRIQVINKLQKAKIDTGSGFKGPADLWIIDLPYPGDSWVRQAEALGIRTLALDFDGSENPDAIISIVDRQGVTQCSQRFAGLEYAIIRQDILEIDSSPKGNGILVCIGSGDIKGKGEAIAKFLAGGMEDVTLVLGALQPKPSKHNCSFETVWNPSDFAVRLANCRWAVTNAGSLMMEMMCLGKAVHVIPQTLQEEELANIVLSKEGILGVGEQTLQVPDPWKIEKVARRARELIDGRGKKRIATIIEELN